MKISKKKIAFTIKSIVKRTGNYADIFLAERPLFRLFFSKKKKKTKK